MTAQAFNDALNAILTLADKLKPWTPLVESAYERLPRHDRPSARFFIMSFRSVRHDHEGVLQLIPKRFTGEFAPVELAYVLEATFELGRTELMEKLAKRLPRAVSEAENPTMQSHLLLCLAEFLARKGKWDETIAVLETVQSSKIFNRNAVTGIVEVHVVRALLALQHGCRVNDEFNRKSDPEMEITLPRNDQALLAQAANEFQRLRKLLEKIVPEKRQQKLGLLVGW